MKRSMMVVAMVVALAAAACSGDGGGEATTTTAGPIGTTTTTSGTGATTDDAPFGFVADLLNRVEDTRPEPHRSFGGDLNRVSGDAEGAYVAALRDADLTDQGVEVDWSVYSDDDLLFAGYLYCLVRDNGGEVSDGFGAVVSEVLARTGAAGGQAEPADLATAITMVNFSTGSLCGQFYVETREFLEGTFGASG